MANSDDDDSSDGDGPTTPREVLLIKLGKLLDYDSKLPNTDDGFTVLEVQALGFMLDGHFAEWVKQREDAAVAAAKSAP